MTNSTPPTVLLTGSTGYVGGRLLPLLTDAEISVRCMNRRSSEHHASQANVETVIGNVLDYDSLPPALEGIETAYYFIHSMGDNEDFERTDRRAAQNFARACTESGVKRIVYLGGLGDEADDLSTHLRSRLEIGNILRTSEASVIEFQASIIIGSGSLSFELIRALVERLPVMICPRWVRVQAQPIAIEDVLGYLLEAVQKPVGPSKIYQIGGPEQISYGEIMRRYAKKRKLRRTMIPVPLLTPYLSSLWLGLVTPLYCRVGRKLVDSLRNPTIVDDFSALDDFSITPRSVEEAISRALIYEDKELAETRWSDSFSAGGEQPKWGGVRFGSRLVDSRKRKVNLTPQQAFVAVRRIGGQTGWYYGNWLWKIRGFLDLLVGGVGIRRGRRHPDELRVGDALDFWRVDRFEDHRWLRLHAEMKVPGRAWLEFEVSETEESDSDAPGQKEGVTSTVRQTAVFDPVGLFGIVYWYTLYPLHQFVFEGMLRNLCKAAEKEALEQPAKSTAL